MIVHTYTACNDEYLEKPEGVAFEVGPALIEDLRKLSKIVKDNEISHM